MTIELKQEILNLIESPKLHAYLMEDTERLKLRDYVSIIAGAPVGLKRKQGLLYKLRATSDTKQQDTDYLKLCCECIDQAVQYLTMESEKIFLIQLMGYDDDNKSDIIILMEECVKAEGNSELQYEKMNQLRKYKNILPEKIYKSIDEFIGTVIK